MLYSDTVRVGFGGGGRSLSFVCFCGDVPDDGRTAETRCAWLRKDACSYSVAVFVFLLAA
jgi:hypothetical protein